MRGSVVDKSGGYVLRRFFAPHRHLLLLQCLIKVKTKKLVLTCPSCDILCTPLI